MEKLTGKEQNIKIGMSFTATDKLGNAYTYTLQALNPDVPMREFILRREDGEITEVEAAWFLHRQITLIQMPPQRLFVDMDGTLATFQQVDRLEALYEYGYFGNLKPMQSVVNAVRLIHQNQPGIEVFILSAYLSDSPYALIEKNQWLDQHLPEIDAEHRIFCPCGEDKTAAVPDEIRPDDVLLDDYTHNLNQWARHARGIKLYNGINHTKGTWKGDIISSHRLSSEIAAEIVSAMQPPDLEERLEAEIPVTDCFVPMGWPEERRRMVDGFVLADGTVLLESERDPQGRYRGGAGMEGMYLQTGKLYEPVQDAEGRIHAFREVKTEPKQRESVLENRLARAQQQRQAGQPQPEPKPGRALDLER